MRTCADKITDRCIKPCYNLSMRLVGPFMVVSLYLLVVLHVYAYFAYIVGVLFKRLGKNGAIGWVAVGLIILYNILYNHVLAVTIKPGSPKD